MQLCVCKLEFLCNNRMKNCNIYLQCIGLCVFGFIIANLTIINSLRNFQKYHMHANTILSKPALNQRDSRATQTKPEKLN